MNDDGSIERRQCASDIAEIRRRLDENDRQHGELHQTVRALERKIDEQVIAPLGELIDLAQWTRNLRRVLCPVAKVLRRVRAGLLWIAGLIGALAVIVGADDLVVKVRGWFGL